MHAQPHPRGKKHTSGRDARVRVRVRVRVREAVYIFYISYKIYIELHPIRPGVVSQAPEAPGAHPTAYSRVIFDLKTGPKRVQNGQNPRKTGLKTGQNAHKILEN